MRVHSRWPLSVWLLTFVLSAASSASAQVRPDFQVLQPQQRFDSGQDIQPIFEGWTPNNDGSFNFLFGYLNRNYVEEPSVPVGPNNFFSPGPEDLDQPAYFYPRTQRYQFQVRVPADWGPTAELVWTLTVNGTTNQAYGWLQPEWEIDVNTITSNNRTGRGRDTKDLYVDQPPSITAQPVQPVTLAEPLTLTASVTDDGLPPDLPERKRSAPDPTLRRPDDAPPIPDNIPQYSKPAPPRNGLAVLWIVHRGPAAVTFAPGGYQAVTDGDGKTSGKTVTTAMFSEPGTYVLRAIASDGLLLTPTDVTVTATATSSQR